MTQILATMPQQDIERLKAALWQIIAPYAIASVVAIFGFGAWSATMQIRITNVENRTTALEQFMEKRIEINDGRWEALWNRLSNIEGKLEK